MSHAIRIVFAAGLALGLAACQKAEEAKPAAQPAAAPAPVLTTPTDGNPESWKAFLAQELRPHVDRRYRRPFVYFIPDVVADAPDAVEQQRQYDSQLENVQNTIGRGVQSGSMLAFGGPNSTKVGDVIVESFALAGPKSLKGVRVVVIAKPEERARIEAAVLPTEPDFIWVDIK
jgi:hypothetical protein